MKFEVTMKIEVAEPDTDVLGSFENAVYNRFDGTAIKIKSITVMPVPPEEAGP